MTSKQTTLNTFNELNDRDGDVLIDLIHRVEWMEAQPEAGYGPAINFYKRIIERIENETSN